MLGFLYQKGTSSADDGGVCFYREDLRGADEKQYYNGMVFGGRGRAQGRGDWSIFLIGTGVGASIALTLLKLGGCGRRGLFVEYCLCKIREPWICGASSWSGSRRVWHGHRQD